ncbi:MAG: VOC family protein [Fusicatenibacter sp.]|nr:VOC family protein [Fusicatenibacter sp.]
MGKLFQGAAHTAFNVSDMEKSLDFYQRVFGFEKAFEMRHPGTGEPWIVYISIGGGQFMELFYGGVKTAENPENAAGFSHVCFAVSDIHEACRRLEEAGAPVDVPIQQGLDHNWQCWTHDPDGNRIELMQMMEDSLQSTYLRQ